MHCRRQSKRRGGAQTEHEGGTEADKISQTKPDFYGPKSCSILEYCSFVRKELQIAGIECVNRLSCFRIHSAKNKAKKIVKNNGSVFIRNTQADDAYAEQQGVTTW